MANLRLSCPRCGPRVPAEASRHGQLIPCPDCAAPLYVLAGAAPEMTGATRPPCPWTALCPAPTRHRPRRNSPPSIPLPPGTPVPRPAGNDQAETGSGPLFVVVEVAALRWRATVIPIQGD